LRIAEQALSVQVGEMKKMVLIVAGVAGFGTWAVRSENKIDFARDIQPILQKSCVECHGPEKPKAKLRLDSREAALKGGKDGVVIVPGNADKSEAYRRITLPAGNDDVMPNKGDLLTKAQTDLIRDWINQGAEWPEGVVIAAKKTEEPEAPASTTPNFPNYKTTAAELKAITMLESLGVVARPIAANSGWSEINFHAQGSEVVDKALAPLSEVIGVVSLDLAGTKIKDADLKYIQGLTNLHRLHLENTPVTDAGLAHLKGLVNLNYLNLYGTTVTDAGLEQLKGLTHLKHLYLWQTKATEAEVASLKKALPDIDISMGTEIKAAAKQGDKKDEKKEEKK
jgi:mono/diheme cytochrome c family protein